MPDITICKNYECKIKNKCYRYLAKPDKYQSYGIFISDTVNNCFVPINKDINNNANK